MEFLITKISRKYEIKKQVIGEDADFKKSGRIWNRVVEWGRDGITIEADQRHIKEILRKLKRDKRVTQLLRATWIRIMRTMQEMTIASERTDAIRDRLGTSTSGTV